MSIYDDIAGAQATIQSKYVTPGTFVCKVNDWKQGRTRKEESFFALEMTVLASDNHEEHPVGSDMTWMVMSKHDSAAGNIKRAIVEIVGLADEPQVTPALCEALLNPNTDENLGELGVSPAAGTIVGVVATNTKTRAGKDFTLVAFTQRNPEDPLPELAHRPRAVIPVAPVQEAPPVPAVPAA